LPQGDVLRASGEEEETLVVAVLEDRHQDGETVHHRVADVGVEAMEEVAFRRVTDVVPIAGGLHLEAHPEVVVVNADPPHVHQAPQAEGGVPIPGAHHQREGVEAAPAGRRHHVDE